MKNQIYIFSILAILLTTFSVNAYAIDVSTGVIFENGLTRYTSQTSFSTTNIQVANNQIVFEDRFYNLTSASGKVFADINEFSRLTNFNMTITNSTLTNVVLVFNGTRVAFVELGNTQFPVGTRWTLSSGTSCAQNTGDTANVQVNSDTKILLPISNFGCPLSDSVTSSDATVKNPTKSAAESLTSSDATVKSPTKSAAESLTSSDLIVKSAAKFLTESVNLTDTVSIVAQFIKNITDSLLFADTTARAFSKKLDDTITLSDTLDHSGAFFETLVETINANDNIGNAVSKAVAEAMTLADNASTSVTFSKNISEALTLSDATATSATLSKTISEALTLSDATATSATFSKTISEAISMADATAKAATTLVQESMTLADTTFNSAGFSETISEAMTLVDNASNNVSKSITETMNIVDSTTSTTSFFRNLAESIAIADATATSATFSETISEAMTLADNASTSSTLSKNISEALTLSDATATSATLSKDISEAMTLADNASTTRALSKDINEVIGIADTTANMVSKSITASLTLADSTAKDASKAIKETTTFVDTISETTTIVKSISESLNFADNVSTITSLSKTLSESITLTDNVKSAGTFFRTLTESLKISDALNAGGALVKTLTETIGFSDTASAISVLSKTLNELFTLGDAINSVLTTNAPSESLSLSTSISFRHDIPTGIGSPLTINFLGGPGVPAGGNVTFPIVTSVGITSATTQNTAEPPPSGLVIAGLGGSILADDLSTTAVYTGPLQVCVTYNDTGLTPAQEAAVQLRHFTGSWVDITTSRDSVNNIVCGQTTSLAPFAVMFPAVPPTAPSAPTAHRGDSACNIAITNDPTAIGQCLIVDTMPPTILSQDYQPTVPVAGSELRVTANIEDNVGVGNAYLLYFINGTKLEFHQVLMQPSQGWFAGTIPSSDVRTVGLRYWIFAEDLAGNTVQSSMKNLKVEQAPPVPEEKTKQTSIPASVLAAIKPIPVTPTQKIEVLSMKSGHEINSLPDKIVIRNTGNVTADNIRIMLSTDIYKSFRLSHSMIDSIEPHSNVTITLELTGGQNKDVLGNMVGHQGSVLVIGEHLTPISLPVNVVGEKSNSLSAFMDKVANMEQQRYNKLSLINSILSKHQNIQPNYEVATSKGENVITSPSGEIVIKNLSDKQLQNLRIVIYGAGSVFLLENNVIHHLDPHAQISVKMIPTVDPKNYSPRDFKGELLIVPSNDNPIHIPINITAADRKDSANEFEVRTLLGKDGIFTGADKIVIKNLGNRTMDSVKLMLSSNLARVLTLSTDSFKHIEPNGQAVVDVKFKEEKGEHSDLEYNYQGELVVVSEHHMQKVIPINIVWKELSSDHFTIHARNNQTDLAKAKDVISSLESNYQTTTSRFGSMNTKTVIYMTNSMDELRTITKSNSYYAPHDDSIFICACADDVKSLAMKEFVHRIIFNEFPSYSNKEKFLMDGENWLMDGISNYIAANMTGEHMVKKEVEAFKAKPTSFVWYGAGSDAQYGAAYTFFEYLHDKYGDNVIDRTLYYLGSGMVSNHRCNTLEDCAVLRAVYDVSGWSMNKSYRHTIDVDALIKEWEAYAAKHYGVAIPNQDQR